MNEYLAALEDKVAQVVALCANLQRENSALQVQLSDAAGEKTALTQRLAAARQRLEQLLARLPEA